MESTQNKQSKNRLEKAPDLRLTRVFDAPRRLVFDAWTKAEHVQRWFAPRPLTLPQATVDFRPGGVFSFLMRTPDGIEFPFEGKFEEIAVPERIVFTGLVHEGEPGADDGDVRRERREDDGDRAPDVHVRVRRDARRAPGVDGDVGSARGGRRDVRVRRLGGGSKHVTRACAARGSLPGSLSSLRPAPTARSPPSCDRAAPGARSPRTPPPASRRAPPARRANAPPS